MAILLATIVVVGCVPCAQGGRPMGLQPETVERKQLLSSSAYGLLEVVTSADESFAIDRIVIGEDAVESVSFAADELQYFVLKATGKKLLIAHEPSGQAGAFFVGRSPHTEQYDDEFARLKREGFLILRREDNIIIAGRDEEGPAIPGLKTRRGRAMEAPDEFIDRSTMHGVYTFLENYLRIRWYWPGLAGTVAPRQSHVSIPKELRLIDAPAYTYRLVHATAGTGIPGVSVKDYLLWGVRNKAFGSVGFLCNHVTHDWQERFAEAHPEWFALEKDGRRDINPSGRFSGLCFSRPEVREQMLTDIDSHFDGAYKRPFTSARFASVCPNDGRRHGCHCELCLPKRTDKRGNDACESEIVWRFVKSMADGVRDKYPDLTITCFGYNTYRQPPQTVTLPDNVVVQITTGAGGITLYDLDKDWNSYRTYRQPDEWLKKVDSLYLWTYFNTRHRRERKDIFAFYPFHIERFFNELPDGVKGLFVQVGYPRAGKNDNWIMDHLTSYLTYRFMWNPKQDVRPLLEEYYEQFYGPASEPMADFYAAMAESWINIAKAINEKNRLQIQERGCPNFLSLGDPDSVYTRGFNSAQIERLEDDLSAATELTAAESIYRTRLTLLKKATTGFFDRAKKLNTHSKPKTIARKVSVPPVIDGTLGDNEWSGRLELKPRSEAGDKISTTAMIAYDEEYLYVAFDCAEPVPETLKRKTFVADSIEIWPDDSVELFLTPSNSLPFHLIANFGESIFDCKGNDSSWRSHAIVKTARTTAGWQAEIAIPWHAWTMDRNRVLTNERGVAVNFHRHRPARGDEKAILWEYYKTFGPFSNVAAHGVLVFRAREMGEL